MHQGTKALVLFMIAAALLTAVSACGKTPSTVVGTSPAPAASAVSPHDEASQAAATASQGYDKGDVMPDFSVALTDGTTFELSKHAGKVVFINLFATWCQPCMGEMPDIQKLYAKYGGKADFVAVDVGGDDVSADVSLAKKNSYTFPMANSPDGSFGSYGVQFIPQTFILGADGKIAFYASGASDYETFSGELDKLLG